MSQTSLLKELFEIIFNVQDIFVEDGRVPNGKIYFWTDFLKKNTIMFQLEMWSREKARFANKSSTFVFLEIV